MTNSWTDIKNTDLVVIMGGNAAEAHPCGFKWVTEAKANRGAKLIVVDPRYTRSASVADFYAPIRQGTDIAFLLGVINYCIANDKVQWDYVKAFTNAPYVVKDGFDYQDGLFTGYDEAKRDYNKATWDYQLGDDGYVVSDMDNPKSVWNLLKKHVAVYTPETVERICGTPKDKFLKVAKMISETSAKDKIMTSMYALGWTQHSKGSQNIRAMAMLQLILGNIGVRGGGMNALRGHSNIQGLTDLGLMSNLIPGYLTIPTEKETTLDAYMSTRGFKPLRPNQMSYWQNYKKFFVSFQKSMWGDAATADNSFAYDYLPKLDVPGYDVLRAFELMFQGKMNGYVCQGFNPLLSFPNRKKLTAALSKLKFLVVMDPLQTETARFWQNHGEYNDVDTASIQTEVIELPTTCFAEDEGSLTNSGRWLQWHWAGGTPPGEAKHDTWIMAQLYLRLKALYQKEGGAYSDPLTATGVALQGSGRAEARRDRQGDQRLRRWPTSPIRTMRPRSILQKGKQVVSFAVLRDDGTTACGCWIYSGCFNEAGNNMARRDNKRSGRYRRIPELVVVVAGQPPHPLQSRVGGHRRQAVGSEPQAVVVGRRQMDRLRRAGHRADRQAGRGRALHHEPGRHRAAVHAGLDARRAVPRALRAVRIADRQSAGAEDSRQSGRPRVQGRHGAVRRRQGVPLRGDLLPAHRALPLLDQARPDQRLAATGVLRRDLRAARRREVHQKWRLGAGLVEARLGQGEGLRHQADRAADLRRQNRAHRRHSPALGLHGRGEEGLRPELAHALCRRRQHRDA